MGQDKVQVNLRGMFLALIVVIGVIIFSVGALANDDPLWFLPVFNAAPQRIVVYQGGCRTELIPGQPGFDELTTAINQTLPQYDGFSSTFGMSAESTKETREKERAVEIFYAKPVTIHTPYRFGHPDSIFIPLSSYFADAHSVFGGRAGEYWSGALRLKSIEPIQRAAEMIPCAR
ncbi:MAG: hypothetical protein KGJ80_12665 [Chloroflexota bacterium]|nr:hypothetical protein [Chloroflexota bacterium]